MANRANQIAIGRRIAYNPSEKRRHHSQVGIEQASRGAASRFGDVDHGKAGARAHDSSQFSKRLGQVIEIPQHEPTDGGAEGSVGKREPEGAALNEAHPMPELLLPALQHRVAQVDPDDLGLVGNHVAELPRPASEIEDSVAAFDVDRIRGATTPPAIHSE